MQFWIDIEDSSGNKQGSGPITTALNWDNIDRLDRAGKFMFEMPATDERAELVVSKRIARCWGIVDDSVTELGAGIIDEITVRTGDPVLLRVSGVSIARELNYRSVGFEEISDGSGAGVTTALADIMAFAPAGWALDAVNGYSTTSGLVYAKYAGESVLNALIKLSTKTGEHFRISSDRKVVWLRTDSPDSGVRAIHGADVIAVEDNTDVALITALEEVKDTYETVSRIYPYGSGTGEARLTLAPTNRSAASGYTLSKADNYIKRDAAESSYGQIERYLSFKDIMPVSNTDADQQTAANMLYDAAYEWLKRHSAVSKFYRLAVAKLDQALLPGQTINVVYRRSVDGYDAVDIDGDLNILEVTNRIDQTGIRTVALQVADIDRWPMNDNEILVGQMDEGRVFEAFPQMNANSYVTGYREPMDDGTSAVFDFWLGSEVITVNQVVFRFKVDKLRSTVASADDGGEALDTDVNYSGTLTAKDGGGFSTTDGQHQHNLDVNDDNAHTDDALFAATPSAGLTALYTNSGHGNAHVQTDVSVSTDHNHYQDDHQHSIDPHDHTVDLPDHTHDMIYGLFEEVAGNTLAETDLVYKVNGGSDLGGDVVSLTGDWFELDITAEVSDATTFRPDDAENQLVISTLTADKTALITGQLLVRTVILASGLI